ncbi:BnaA09g40780D [Brassica napus]|uniref:BnaA09g40780D protein n=1 Tax=Brassica napus TaxID=3708 RepID=A0A078FEW6_BRANA|nr:BnaA09g40780D [Brassica napus]
MQKTRATFRHKDQTMSQSVDRQTDLVGHNNNNNNKVITNPLAMSLLIGLKKDKCISDSDFVRSPKSPLEFKMLSTMAADPFFFRSPRSSLTAHLNCPAKVGLSIVDSLGDDRVLSPDVVFGPALRIKSSDIKDKHPKSLKIEKERSGVIFEIGSFSADDCPTKTRVLSQSKFPRIGSDNAFSSEDEMEMSEDYTCIITHGPNPKTTHIYGDQVLDCHKNGDDNKEKSIETELDSMFPLDNFLRVCNFCNKKLVLGKDIYMYRGEKAFCSAECRSEEMTIDEDDLEDSCVVMHGSLKQLLF